QGAEALEEPETSGSMEALGVRPLDADPLQRLEPGLDLERTRPHLSSSRLPKTRIPSTAPHEDENTVDRGRVGDWLRGSAAPVAIENAGAQVARAEDDFSDLADEPPEDRAKTQTRARVLIGETPGRKVTEGPDGTLIVELEAELPDEYEISSPLEFAVDLGSMEGQESASQLDAEPPTLSRLHSAADTPAIDDSLLGFDPELAPP